MLESSRSICCCGAKESVIVGHLLQPFFVCTQHFLQYGGTIVSKLTGSRRYLNDSEQGRMKSLCMHRFTGADNLTKMSHRLLIDEHDGIGELQCKKSL